MAKKKTDPAAIENDPFVPALDKKLSDIRLDASLDQNIAVMDALFQDVDITIKRRFQNCLDDGLEFCIYYTDGIVNSMLINEHIIKPLLYSNQITPDKQLLDSVKDSFVMANEVKESTDLTEIIEAVTYGDTILFAEGFDKALVISSKSFMLRSISEPETEKVLEGPREGFTEGILMNLCMVRRRIRSHQLKMTYRSMGEQSATTVCVCYIDGIVNPKILSELLRRLDRIDMDCVLDSNYISEQITEASFMSFPTCGKTERPDIVTARLLEGRIAVFVDGTPMVLTLPYLFLENFQSNEDYYVNNIYGTFSRLIRIFGFVLAIIIPATYVAIVAYHHEIMPISLMINITYERLNVPLPASIECFIMLICFDVLREAGIRMPSQVGQALSIVGALVIGQAGVEANLVAAPMIIIVALTGITGLTAPRLWAPSLFCRYFLLLMASSFGLYGMLVGISIILTHLFNLNTLGVSYTLMPRNLQFQNVKDTFFRARWSNMLTRYLPLSQNHIRSNPKPLTVKKGKRL